MKKVIVGTVAALSLAGYSMQASAAEQNVETNGVEATNSIQAQTEARSLETEIFPLDEAITYAENFVDNDSIVFSSNGEVNIDSEGNVYYQLRAQNKEWVENGGSGTIGFFNVYPNGKVEKV